MKSFPRNVLWTDRDRCISLRVTAENVFARVEMWYISVDCVCMLEFVRETIILMLKRKLIAPLKRYLDSL